MCERNNSESQAWVPSAQAATGDGDSRCHCASVRIQHHTSSVMPAALTPIGRKMESSMSVLQQCEDRQDSTYFSTSKSQRFQRRAPESL